MRHLLFILALGIGLSACATASRFTIEDRLRELGLSREYSGCIADELAQRLDSRELNEFARFTVRITGGGDRDDIIRSLSDISNDRIARAVSAAALSCVISF
jgi:hypothetical protein